MKRFDSWILRSQFITRVRIAIHPPVSAPTTTRSRRPCNAFSAFCFRASVWNTQRLQRAVERESQRTAPRYSIDALRSIGPVGHRHINFRGWVSRPVASAGLLTQRPMSERRVQRAAGPARSPVGDRQKKWPPQEQAACSGDGESATYFCRDSAAIRGSDFGSRLTVRRISIGRPKHFVYASA